MNNNFECKYMSVGGTFCFHYDYEIGLNDTECHNCEANNNCECCDWKTSHPENCKDCIVKEGEDE
jgi:hypothetical protein